jgi:adenylate cyclase
VLAGECLQTNESGWGECGEPPGQTPPKHSAIQIVNYPTPKLAKSMLDHGLFYLRYNGKDNVVRQAWTFLDSPINRPTLPVLSWFHFQNQKGALQEILQPTAPLSNWLSEKRRNCRNNVTEITTKLSKRSNLENRINDLICQGNSRYLDFYGPPKTSRMESYGAVREGRISDLKDKIVFVGKVPIYGQPSKDDSFETPVGLMAGVEVMATFFANLLEDREIKHPLPTVLVMVIFGVIVSFLLTKFVGRNGIVASLLFSACYAKLAVMGFNNYSLWLPLFLPILLQLPIASFISLYWWHIDHLKEEKRLKAIIDQLEKENKEEVNRFIDEFKKTYNPNLEIKKIRSKGEVSGVCLVSDIEGSVELCQKYTSSESSAIFSEYFKVLEPIVSSHGGEIVQIAGDGMIAIWVDPGLANKKLAACKAAIKMKQAVDEYYSSGRTVLPTRFGLHEGTFTLEQVWPEKPEKPGNVVGDVVNTASRIEQVNKILGTKILVSSLVAIDLINIITRPVGAFPLKGKTYPLSLVEIVSIKSETNLRKYFLIRRYFYQFKHGLKAFQSGDWVAAQKVFCTLNEKNINDGPTKYYLKMSQIYLDNPPSK